MKNVRLLPVVVLAIAALLVLKTLGLVTNGGYVLTGVAVARAESASAGGEGGATTEADSTLTLPGEPTLTDTSPTLSDSAPTLGQQAETAAGDHGAPTTEDEPVAADPAAEGVALPPIEPAATEPPVPVTVDSTFCVESDAAIQNDGTVIINPASAVAAAEGGHGETPAAEGEGESEAPAAPVPSFAASMADCLPSGDAVPLQIDGKGGTTPLVTPDGGSLTETQLLERLAARRTELEQYERDLALRASIVDAAEQRIAERTATLEALEAQISALVDQRTEMETGQFAGIVAMYETMKPKDAANIFNNLDMDVLLRVAKTMSPRKMAPVLAEMDFARAQELTVKMANLADQPATDMSAEDLAALPQIVGQ